MSTLIVTVFSKNTSSPKQFANSVSEVNPTNSCMVKLLRLLLSDTASVALCKAVSVYCFSLLEVNFQDYHSVLRMFNT